MEVERPRLLGGCSLVATVDDSGSQFMFSRGLSVACTHRGITAGVGTDMEEVAAAASS